MAQRKNLTQVRPAGAPTLAGWRSNMADKLPALDEAGRQAMHAELGKLDPKALEHLHGSLGKAMSEGGTLGGDYGTLNSMHLMSHPELQGAILQRVVSPMGEYNAKAHGALASMMEAAKAQGVKLTPHHIEAMSQHPMFDQLVAGTSLGGNVPHAAPTFPGPGAIARAEMPTNAARGMSRAEMPTNPGGRKVANELAERIPTLHGQVVSPLDPESLVEQMSQHHERMQNIARETWEQLRQVHAKADAAQAAIHNTPPSKGGGGSWALPVALGTGALALGAYGLQRHMQNKARSEKKTDKPAKKDAE